MPKNIEIIFEQSGDLKLDLKRIDVDSLKSAKEYIEDAGNRAFGSILSSTPLGSGATIASLRKGSPTYKPGGRGGGGTWEIQHGFLRTQKNAILYYHFGTAQKNSQKRIYPSQGRQGKIVEATGRALLTKRMDDPSKSPKPIGNRPVLSFEKLGERRFRAWVSGQEPNKFVYVAYVQASLYLKIKLEKLPGKIYPTI